MEKNKRSTKNSTAKQTKKSRLLANLDVVGRYNNLARESRLTAEGCLRRWGNSVRFMTWSPRSLQTWQ